MILLLDSKGLKVRVVTCTACKMRFPTRLLIGNCGTYQKSINDPPARWMKGPRNWAAAAGLALSPSQQVAACIRFRRNCMSHVICSSGQCSSVFQGTARDTPKKRAGLESTPRCLPISGWITTLSIPHGIYTRAHPSTRPSLPSDTTPHSKISRTPLPERLQRLHRDGLVEMHTLMHIPSPDRSILFAEPPVSGSRAR